MEQQNTSIFNPENYTFEPGTHKGKDVYGPPPQKTKYFTQSAFILLIKKTFPNRRIRSKNAPRQLPIKPVDTPYIVRSYNRSIF